MIDAHEARNLRRISGPDDGRFRRSCMEAGTAMNRCSASARATVVGAVVATLCALSAGGCGANRAGGRIWDYYSVHGGPNSGIIWTEYGVIAVDTQETPSGGYLVSQQAAQTSQKLWEEFNRAGGNLIKRTDPPPVLYVMNTSHLPAAWFGNQSFTQAEIISSAVSRKLMRDEFDLLKGEVSGRHSRRELEDLRMTLPTMSVEGELALHTPQSDIRFIVLPSAPLPGMSVVFLESERVLFAGALVPGRGIPDARGRRIPEWIEALEFVEKLNPVAVLPASGAPVEGRRLAALRDYLSRLWAAAGTAAEGAAATAEEAATDPKFDLPEFREWENYGLLHRANVAEALRQRAGGRARGGGEDVRNASPDLKPQRSRRP